MSMASSGSSRMVKGECDYYGKSHSGECRKKLGAYFGCGSRGHLVKDCPSKSNFSTEQLVRSPQKLQHENRSKMETKSSSIQGSQRKNFCKTSSNTLARAYVMKVKEDADLLEVITSKFSFLGNNIYFGNNPLDQSTVVNKLINNCPLSFSEHVFFLWTCYC